MDRMTGKSGTTIWKKGAAIVAALALAGGLAAGCGGPDGAGRDNGGATGTGPVTRQRGAGMGIAAAPGITGRNDPGRRSGLSAGTGGSGIIGEGRAADGTNVGTTDGGGAGGDGAGQPVAPVPGGPRAGTGAGTGLAGPAGRAGNEGASSTTIPFELRDGTPYADITRIADVIGFNRQWTPDGRMLLIGDHDPVLALEPGSSSGVKEERAIDLNGAALKDGSRLLVPAAALRGLFDGEAAIVVGEASASVMPVPDQHAKSAGFGEDQTVPPRAARTGSGEAEQHPASRGGFRIMSTASDILVTAQSFMGVPYDFGAGSYDQTKRFDCSSFVQYVFGRNGIQLPRTARGQSEHGMTIARNNLRPGDLMFFYVPGRFKSNLEAGHVAIYKGGGEMIHSSPLPDNGVQITSIDKAYWRDTFLFAKRYT